MPKPSLVVRSLWLLVLLAGCGKHGTGDPTSCEAVGAKVRAVSRAELDAQRDLPAATRHGADLALGPVESEIAKRCRDTRWPADVRDCIIKGETGAQLAACARALTPDQRGAPATPNR